MKPLSSQTRERQVEHGVQDDHPDVRVVQAQLAVHQEEGDRHHDRRQHARAQDEEEQVRLPGSRKRLKA